MTKLVATTSQMGVAEWGLLLLLSILWGGSFIFYKVLVAGLPPLTIVFGRVCIDGRVLRWRPMPA